MQIEPFVLERWMTHWELDVTHDIAESGILPLSLEDIYHLIPEGAASDLEKKIRSMPLGYSEARGTEELRETLASTYPDTTADEILITTGAIEANFLLFSALVRPGDHVIVVDPAYQQLQSVPKAFGANVDLWSVVKPDGYRYDLNDLKALVQDTTRLIVINSPHNPTGAMLTDDELDEIVEIARERDAWILCDEAYRWLEIPGGETMPRTMRGRYEKGISVGTVSKPFGIPGIRIGWFAAPAEVATKAWSLRDYVSLSPSKISDAIATTVIANREPIFARNSLIIGKNLAEANRWFDEHRDLAAWNPPRAGLLALMRYSPAISSSEMADRLAAEKGVMLAPGSAFGIEGSLRIGIGQRPDIFAEGLARTAEMLQCLSGEN